MLEQCDIILVMCMLAEWEKPKPHFWEPDYDNLSGRETVIFLSWEIKHSN